MSSRLHADARGLREVVRFARQVGTMREPEAVLEALERALRDALPGAGWHVLSHRAIEDGTLPAETGLTPADIEKLLTAEGDDWSSSQGTADTGSGRVSTITVPISHVGGEERAMLVMALRHLDLTYGLAVGDVSDDDDAGLRHAELLCRTAVAALRNAELLQMVIAQEKLAVLGRVAAEVTHEMSNPLAFVLANLRVLEQELHGEAHEAVAESRAGAERLERIVRDLSSLARGGICVELDDFNLVDLAREAVRVARSRSQDAVVEVDARDPVAARADAGRVEQVLVNLIVNGIDAAIAASAEPKVTVQVRLEAGHGRAVVEVVDNGGGIPPSAQRRIFDAFFTTKGVAGTGLGLYLSKSLAQAMDGDLELVATGPSGTRFRLSLPRGGSEARLATDVTAMPVRVGPASAAIEGRPRILVLDDEVSLVRALQRWLGLWADVTGTTDPRRALELAVSGKFTIVLCDLNMPAMSGLEFVEALRQRNPEAVKAVVIMTGSGAADAPGVPVVRKPIQPAVIEDLLQRRERAEDPGVGDGVPGPER
jgi:signal transduction histidine kinase